MGSDFYRTLGLQWGATPEEVKKAYRRLAMRWQPDNNPNDDTAEEMFKKVVEAYEVPFCSQIFSC